MPKSRSIGLKVEGLESKMLLTAAMIPVHALATTAAHVAPVSAEAVSTHVALHGTIHGTGTLNGTTLTVHGSGNLGKVGVASVRGNLNLASLPSSITLTTPRGHLTLTATAPQVVLGTSGYVTYAITGGTHAYAHATGSGLLSGSFSVVKGDKIAFSAHFS